MGSFSLDENGQDHCVPLYEHRTMGVCLKGIAPEDLVGVSRRNIPRGILQAYALPKHGVISQVVGLTLSGPLLELLSWHWGEMSETYATMDSNSSLGGRHGRISLGLGSTTRIALRYLRFYLAPRNDNFSLELGESARITPDIFASRSPKSSKSSVYSHVRLTEDSSKTREP